MNILYIRFIPEKYIALESVRMSIYKSLTSATLDKELDDILYNLVNRFGPVPDPVTSLIKESRLRLIASRVGICSLVRRPCGVVCSVENRTEQHYASAVIDYAENFFNKSNVNYHIVPTKRAALSLCVHFENNEDIYSLFSRFLGKFDALVEVN